MLPVHQPSPLEDGKDGAFGPELFGQLVKCSGSVPWSHESRWGGWIKERMVFR